MNTIQKEKLVKLKNNLKTSAAQLKAIYKEHAKLEYCLTDALLQLQLAKEVQDAKDAKWEALKAIEEFKAENI